MDFNSIIEHFKVWGVIYSIFIILIVILFTTIAIIKRVTNKKQGKIKCTIYTKNGDVLKEIMIEKGEDSFDFKDCKYSVDEEAKRKNQLFFNTIYFLNYEENNPHPFVFSSGGKPQFMDGKKFKQMMKHKWVRELLEVGESGLGTIGIVVAVVAVIIVVIIVVVIVISKQQTGA